MLVSYFPNAHPKTFFRQLSHYKITKLNVLNGGGNDKIPGSFSLRHCKFLRNAPELIFEIECRNRKRCGSNKPPSPITFTATTTADEENVRVDEFCAKQELEHGIAMFRYNLVDLMRSVADLTQDPRYQALLSNNMIE
ncbi:hypothetical protein BASA81_005381 [Batrachochytrium salamandrivorans]|nr:hypothetical protein BASA81_005381 [Batrachochytrium salamandrivorans]